MVDGQVITVGITDRRLIAALSAVPRERFVPAGMVPLAYSDADLLLKEVTPTSPARYLMAVGAFARLVQEAKIDRQDVVLDIGCATGYSSAVLARLANSVIALESDEGLAALATKNLVQIGVDNVAVVTGPLEVGWPDAAPYDVILIGGAIETVPSAVVEQIEEGGRLVAVMGHGHSASGMVYVKSRSAFSGRRVFNAAVRPLPGFAKPKTFVF
jgi:protein-L-isoaspartate(D-aspartate) O-methyltransferase